MFLLLIAEQPNLDEKTYASMLEQLISLESRLFRPPFLSCSKLIGSEESSACNNLSGGG
jgi:hypothetical protein